MMGREIDLTNCDREPIHLPGSIQPFGFLLGVLSDLSICIASENAATFLSVDFEVLRRPLGDVFCASAIDVIQDRVNALSAPDAVERVFGVRLKDGGKPFDLAIHFSGAYLLIEGEPSVLEPDVNTGELVRAMVARIRNTKTMLELAREAARQVKALTGFDRVMVYRFHPDGSGEVIAEVASAGLEPFLGLHYPASDIPKQARILYKRNWLRIIADIRAAPAPLVADRAHSATQLDLSMSVLRSVSPIHIEYLQNMGVDASMSVSILRDGELWGLFACHHYTPRHISFERRTAAELFGQMFSWVLESGEREVDVQYKAQARELQERFIQAAAANGHQRSALADFIKDYRKMIACDGVAVCADGEVVLSGETPSEEQVKGLLTFINRAYPGRVSGVSEMARVYPPAAEFSDRAAGFLAVPLSREPGDGLIFFRKEILRSVHWAGDPNKPVTVGPLGPRLTPRKSFELWRETVRGQSEEWSKADLVIAEGLRVTLLEVVVQLADIAARERQNAQERQELMIAELNHRVRNILSLVRGLVNQGQASGNSLEEFTKVLGGRIQALARAHDQITNLNWGPASLRLLVESEAGAYLGSQGSRLVLDGPDVALDPKAFTTVALVMHELMTNSAKYGALADSVGRVEVSWRFDPRANLILEWKEVGGPPVQAPSRRGFGTTIIERSIPFDLKGSADLRFDLLGVHARFLIPTNYVQLHVAERQSSAALSGASMLGARLDGPVLIVEDNLIIAMSAEVILLELGATRVESAGSVAEALRALARTTPSFAMLDLNLGNENSIPVAEKLKELGTPFIFATGYGERAPLPDSLNHMIVVQKPYTRDVIENALNRLAAQSAKSHPRGQSSPLAAQPLN